MKTIGYVLSTFPVLSETFVGNEMRGMQALGHEVVPISLCRPTQPYQPDDQVLAEITQYGDQLSRNAALKFLLARLHHLPQALFFALRQKGLPVLSLLSQAAKVALIAKRHQCSHLHAHFALESAATAIVAARLLGISVSFVGHGFDVYAHPSDLQLKLQSADLGVAVCRTMLEDFRQLAPGCQLEEINCGIDPEAYHFDPNPSPQQRLLFIGRLAEKKGLHHVIEALSRLPVHERPGLDIVGHGEQRDRLEKLAKDRGISDSVTFMGVKDSQWIRDNAHDYLALVAPFCLAANGDRDTGPLVLKEAMAVGLPVITTRFMGCNQIVSNNTGFFVDSGDIEGLVRAIRSVRRLPPHERLSLVQRARTRVAHFFSIERQVRSLSTCIETL